ncbi:MAG: hypothetical protein RPU63_07215 [Candidatus Sedimenticola sp. (ex Thyasira tokunagai)]
MTELVTSGSVGGMVSDGRLYLEVEDSLDHPTRSASAVVIKELNTEPACSPVNA